MITGTYIAHTRTRAQYQGKDYLRICAGPQRGRYVHQAIAEAMMGRELRDGEVVDHRDGNGLNDAPWNLRVRSVVGNSRRSEPPQLGDVIFCGAAFWKERNPDWVDPLDRKEDRANEDTRMGSEVAAVV